MAKQADMAAKEERLRGRILDTTDSAMDVVDECMRGGEVDERTSMAFRLVNQGVKILHMNQMRLFTERSQALRLLKYLPDEESRAEYIRISNPQAAPLLLSRPKSP